VTTPAVRKSAAADLDIDLYHSVAAAMRGLREQAQSPLDAFLSAVASTAKSVTPAADHVSIMVYDRQRRTALIAATDRHARTIETLQPRTRGPSLRAGEDHRHRRIDDLRSETRWPDFSSLALTRTPIRAMLVEPARLGTHTSVVVTLHADHPYRFDDNLEHLGGFLALHAAIACCAHHRYEDLAGEPTGRDVVAQTTGTLVERFDIDAITAAALLAKLFDGGQPMAAKAQADLHRPESHML
jgi:hypothetical protein